MFVDLWKTIGNSLGSGRANINFCSANGNNTCSESFFSLSTIHVKLFCPFRVSLLFVSCSVSLHLGSILLRSSVYPERIKMRTHAWPSAGSWQVSHQMFQLPYCIALSKNLPATPFFFFFLSYSLDLFTKDPPGRTEEELSCNSLTTLSCHLLCFPFALDLPPLTMSSVLQVYDSCGIHSSLLQVWAFSSSYQHLSLWCNRA